MTVIAMIKNTKTDLIARMTSPDPLTIARKQQATAIDTNNYRSKHKLVLTPIVVSIDRRRLLFAGDS